MQLVEQHVIDRKDSCFATIDAAAFASKNLYNAALYVLRQAFIFEGRYLSYNTMDKLMQGHEAYKELPAKVAQQVLQQLDKNWQSFFEARKAYEEDPSKFLGRPNPPKYKHKTQGRNLLIYTDQAVSRKALKRGFIQPSMLPITVKTKQRIIDQVRIVPKKSYYVVEVVYEQQANVNPSWYAGVDLGVTNLAAIASNKPGFVPRLINGRPVKTWNQWYNKRKSELQKKLGTTGTTGQMKRIATKRNRRVYHYLHSSSRQILDLLVAEGIGTLVIGKNDGWKQEVNRGKQNNQNFVAIPHARFIEMLSYKAALVGIRVLVTEESYTSKASFLDLDPIPVYDQEREEEPKFGGKRVKRGLYRASGRRYINADVNGAFNIIRKCSPDAFAKGVAGYAVYPVRMDRTNQTNKVAS